nr:50S ribosomal protein L4P [uncultured archaeon]
MKAAVLSLEGKKVSEIELPKQFSAKIDRQLIKRAVLAMHSAGIQAKGGYVLAGRDNTAKYVVGGPKAHPPKTEKIWREKINRKEREKAIASAIAATAKAEFVKGRGHILPDKILLPIVLESGFEKLSKTREVKSVLEKLGLWEDVERVHAKKKTRAGKGKKRGRRIKRGKSILFVVSGKSTALMAARNIEGVEVVDAKSINAHLLAPGAEPARLTVWTEAAINSMKEPAHEKKAAKEKIAAKAVA